MNIVTEGITLRAIEQDDMQLLKSLINDPDIENMVVGWSFPVSNHQQINWINNLSNDTRNVRYIIDVQNIGSVGLASLTEIDFKNQTAIINIKLRKESSIRQQGIGYKTICMLIDYGFDQLNLQCIVATILDYNTASQRLFDKCGFVFEGRLRNRVYKNGTYHDLLSYSILRSEVNGNERNRK